ncbi:MAG TPA: hypothetical protein VFJ96_05900 [Gemmatimonadaceae bacterium]|nr:hypothetical protein [Gemmatimonadaceae bacterium]
MRGLLLHTLAQQMPGMMHGPDAFSLFNHRLSGLLVLLLGALAYVDATASGKQRERVRLLWPLPLLLLGLYLLVRSDDPSWPPRFVKQLSTVEGIQHKLFAVMALSLGGIELLRRSGRLTHPLWSYVFYAVMLLAGVFLLFHGGHHSGMVHIEHTAMGVIAIAIAVVKVTADRKRAVTWLSASLLPGLFVLLGLQLLLYVE